MSNFVFGALTIFITTALLDIVGFSIPYEVRHVVGNYLPF
jgi:putative Mn2+ efflux pump MntP